MGQRQNLRCWRQPSVPVQRDAHGGGGGLGGLQRVLGQQLHPVLHRPEHQDRAHGARHALLHLRHPGPLQRRHEARRHGVRRGRPHPGGVIPARHACRSRRRRRHASGDDHAIHVYAHRYDDSAAHHRVHLEQHRRGQRRGGPARSGHAGRGRGARRPRTDGLGKRQCCLFPLIPVPFRLVVVDCFTHSEFTFICVADIIGFETRVRSVFLVKQTCVL